MQQSTYSNGVLLPCENAAGWLTALGVSAAWQTILAQAAASSAAKVWANFNSAGTVAGSYNLTSITDNGTGDFSVVIATDFSGATYAALAFCGRTGGNAPLFQTTDSVAAGAFNLRTAISAGTSTDAGAPDMYFVAAFGAQ
jgi:hypothetical protein